jgi:hypothetical protein
MGKTPNQMVTSGMMMKVGVEMAPTTYDQTPEQYSRRMPKDRSDWNSGQCLLLKMIWKWPCAAKARPGAQDGLRIRWGRGLPCSQGAPRMHPAAAGGHYILHRGSVCRALPCAIAV